MQHIAQILQQMPIMTHNQFLELVREMRFNQKQYFKTRSQTHLRKAQELERQVDSWLRSNTGHQQQSLF